VSRNRPQNPSPREGDRGIEFDSRNHSQIDGFKEDRNSEKTLGGIVFTSKIIPKNMISDVQQGL